MLTQAFGHGDAAAGQFVFHHLLEQAGAAAAARGRFRAAFDAGQIGAAAEQRVAVAGSASTPSAGAAWPSGKIRPAGSAGGALPFCTYCSRVS
ncbi:hypothetical protein G6F54_014030 [Rhizopus delemar]|nr:hypothetical protein G6F54_014030 [Rhizopus delemar]